ncbi:MAG: hypothetical protein J6M53_04355 [Bacteroidaceae bacterium]|nr:hypothetical protein [Bacteroidaceae bacterium]
MKRNTILTALACLLALGMGAQTPKDVMMRYHETRIENLPKNFVAVTKMNVNVREDASIKAPRMQENFGMGYRQVGRWVFPCLAEKNGWYNIPLLPSMHTGWISGTLAVRTGTTPIDLAAVRNKAFFVQDGYIRVEKHTETGLLLMEHHVEIGDYDDPDIVVYTDLYIGRQVKPGLLVFFKSWRMKAEDVVYRFYIENHTTLVDFPNEGEGYVGMDLENIPCKTLFHFFGQPEETIDAQFNAVFVTSDLLKW